MAGAGQGNLLASIRWVLILFFGFSAGLTGFYAGADLLPVAGLVLAGLVVGALIVTIALPRPSHEPRTDRLNWDE